MTPPPVPLARRLGTLEVLDATAWFVRDSFASWALLAGTAGAGFALALAAFHHLASAVPAGVSMDLHFARLQLAALGLAAVFLLRGIGHRAAAEFFLRRTSGGDCSLAACLRGAARAPLSAVFLSGWPSAAALVASLAGIYPGLALVNRWGVALPASVYEDLPPLAALARSARLMERSGSGMALWLLLVLVALFAFVNLLLLGELLPWAVRTLLGLDLPDLARHLSPSNGTYVAFAAGLSFAAADTLRVAAFSLLYLNLRIEREGGDLLARLDRVGAGRRREAEAVRG